MSLRKCISPLAVLLIAGLGAYLLIATAPAVEVVIPDEILPAVRVAEPEVRDIRLWVHSQGTVMPRTESALVPEVSGPITWVSPSLVSGGFFSRDELLLRIDSRDYEAHVAKARAEVARGESEREYAKSELERQEGLARSNATSPSRLSAARRAAHVAEAALDAAQVTLEEALRNVERCELRAPYEGRVREERIDVGQFVARGQSVATLYATDFVEIRLPIADRQLAFLDLPDLRNGGKDAEGPEVVLRAHFGGREHQWMGRIVRTEGEIDSRSRMLHVVARVEDPYGRTAAAESTPPDKIEKRPPLAVGLFVKARIAGLVARESVGIPRAAMRDDNRILVVDDENRLRFREVEVLRIERDQVLIRSQFGPGERICVSPLQVAVEGMRIEPVAANPEPPS